MDTEGVCDGFDARVLLEGDSEKALADVPAARGVAVLLAEDSQPIQILTAADMRSRLRFRP